jgi:hypothetical protein
MDDAINLHKSGLFRYENEIGQLLRQTGTDTDTKRLQEIREKLNHGKNNSPNTKSDNKKKAEKGKDKPIVTKVSKNWHTYADIQVFTGPVHQGKTEVYFEIVNELKAILEKLNQTKSTLSQFANIGLNGVLYMLYVKNGIPKKLVLVPQDKQQDIKFEYKATFVEGMDKIESEKQQIMSQILEVANH